MRDILKNPMVYYLLAPVLVGIWPLLVWGVYLPGAQQASEEDDDYRLEGETYIMDILLKDPDRLKMAGEDQVAGEFSYANAIERVANLCSIPATSCTYSAGKIIPSQGKRFLSKIQSTWVNLSCDKVKLEKRTELPDRWRVSLTFWYHY
jgi:hypothetical protein